MNREEIIRLARDQIDIMWNQALQQSIKDGEQFTRYHFAALVAAAKETELMDSMTIAYMSGYQKGKDAGAAAERDRMCEQFNIPKELAHEKAKSNETD